MGWGSLCAPADPLAAKGAGCFYVKGGKGIGILLWETEVREERREGTEREGEVNSPNPPPKKSEGK